MISLAPVLGFSVLGIPSGDTQNTSDLGTGVPKTRGYPNHCDNGNACYAGYEMYIPDDRNSPNQVLGLVTNFLSRGFPSCSWRMWYSRK